MGCAFALLVQAWWRRVRPQQPQDLYVATDGTHEDLQHIDLDEESDSADDNLFPAASAILADPAALGVT